MPAATGAVGAVRRELRRTNFAGREVTLVEGVAVAVGAVALSARRGRRADAVVLAGIGALGLLDDLVEPRRRRAGESVPKGLRGHLGALRRGRLTTGGAKLLGIPVLCLAGAAAAPSPRCVLIDGALAAGCANLANLLDLRPGRALKALVVPAAVLAWPGDEGRAAAGRSLAVAALVPALLALPADLRERGMLGDGGANVLGAAVGTALARRTSVPGRAALLGGVAGLTLLSERVSFTRVIAGTPVLARLDGLGRRAAGPAGPA